MTDPRQALRHDLRQRRRDLSAGERIAAAESLADALLALPFAPREGAVAGYWALDGEIALHRWQLQLPEGLTYCLPVLAGDVLRFAPWRPGQALTSNRYGIPEPDVAVEDTLEPAQMALVVTPLVGFDTQCRRLGMGAAGMIAASPSATTGRRRPGWSVLHSRCSRSSPCRWRRGTCRWMRSAPKTAPCSPPLPP